uniref:Immunoglobulin superfamily member 6 n=1 Tax=Chrysolophus pictus TaxID=9089 RepID=A0A8C3KZK2_CHRPC
MASVNKFQKVLVLALDWILYSVGATDNCHVTVTQPRFQEAEHSAHTANLTCAFSAHGCSPSQPRVLWFRFFTNRHEDLCTPECTNRQKFQVYASSENNYWLQIKNLTVNDSALYFCGIAFADSGSPHSKQTGDGTVLTKRERHKTEEFNSMIIISTLLLLYSITVFTILAVHKLKRKLLNRSGNEGQRTENCKIRSGRIIFRAIAQELQKQRFAEHCHQPVSFIYIAKIDTYIIFCIFIYNT